MSSFVHEKGSFTKERLYTRLATKDISLHPCIKGREEDEEHPAPVDNQSVASCEQMSADVTKTGKTSPALITIVEKKSFLVNVRQLWDSIWITVFVIGSALILFVAARNSITW